MMENIPLEERLRRIEAGYASSPQVTPILADTFCRTPVIPTLEECGAFYERERLCDLLRSETAKEYLSAFQLGDLPRNGVEDVTYGDLALLIAAHYLRNGNTPSLMVEELISIYFYCIEAIVLQRKMKREEIKSCLRPIYDFMHMSFAEYHEYAKQCGLDEHAEKIDEFRFEKGFSSRMTPIKIFDELKMEICSYKDFCFGLSEDSILTIEQCEHFIDFFVCPVAMIWMHFFVKES